MFKYSKHLMASIRFWSKEFKLRRQENAELDRLSDIIFQEGYGGHNSMAGFGYYMTMNHNRKERLCLHKEQLAAIH